MKGSTSGWMKRGAAAVIFFGLLYAASSTAAAADGLSVTTQQDSTKATVQVRNDGDRMFEGVVDVRVVVSGVAMSVPVDVELAPGQSMSVTLDLAPLRPSPGPLTVITDEGTPF